VYNIKIYDSGYSKSDVAAVDPGCFCSAPLASLVVPRPNDVIDSFSLGFETSILHRHFDRAHAHAYVYTYPPSRRSLKKRTLLD